MFFRFQRPLENPAISDYASLKMKCRHLGYLDDTFENSTLNEFLKSNCMPAKPDIKGRWQALMKHLLKFRPCFSSKHSGGLLEVGAL